MLKHVVEWSEKELSPAMEVLGELSIRALDSVSNPPRGTTTVVYSYGNDEVVLMSHSAHFQYW